MPVHIRNGRVLTPFSQQESVVVVEGERIIGVERRAETNEGTTVIDAEGMYLVPGFVDLRVHGDGTHSVLDGRAQSVVALCNAHAYEGTTTVMPTTDLAPYGSIVSAIDAVREASGNDCDATIAGLHLFGPAFSPDWVDEPSHALLKSPDEMEWRALLDQWDGIRIVGAAPELPGAMAMGDELAARGIIASISHSSLQYEQALAAITHGYSDVTSLFSDNSCMIRKGDAYVPGITECALVMNEFTVQLIADGWQLPMIVLQLIYQSKGPEGILLVSGAGRRGVPADKYDAGFSTMALLVRNMVMAGVSLRVALRMATVNPARRIGLGDRKGLIAAGYDADLVLLDKKLNVRFSMAKGKIVRNTIDMPTPEELDAE